MGWNEHIFSRVTTLAITQVDFVNKRVVWCGGDKIK